MASPQQIQGDLVGVGTGTQCQLPTNDSNKESFIGIDLNRLELELEIEKNLNETKDPIVSHINATNEVEADADMTEIKADSIPSLPPDVTNDKDKAEDGAPKAAREETRIVENIEECLEKKDPIIDLSLSAPMINLNDEPSSESSSPSSRISCITTEFSVVAPSEPPRRPPPITIDLTDDKPRIYPLLLMGCRSCLMYSMVPENDPHCPLCKKAGSIDEFRWSPKKKIKRGNKI